MRVCCDSSFKPSPRLCDQVGPPGGHTAKAEPISWKQLFFHGEHFLFQPLSHAENVSHKKNSA